jgi:hypothetical protein
MKAIKQTEYDNGPSYYGAFGSDRNPVKPKYGVALYVVNEYLKRSIDDEMQKAAKDFSQLQETFRKGNAADMQTMIKRIDRVNEDIKEMIKLLDGVIKKNKLERPPIEKKESASSKKRILLISDRELDDADL